MILITSFGEFLLYFIVIFLFYFHLKKKKFMQDCFRCCLVVPYFYKIECSVGLNCDQMEEGEQYSEYSVESNPRAYMSMRDYKNQWMSSPYGSAYNHSWGNHTNSSWEPRPS